MHIRLHGISKRFGQIRAVDRVDFEARPGMVTALLGENGAGKSTLMKLLFGLHRPDAGRIEFDGRTQLVDSPRTAIRCGIGMVFQQFSLIGSLTVRENLALVLPRSPWWIGRGAGRLVGGGFEMRIAQASTTARQDDALLAVLCDFKLHFSAFGIFGHCAEGYVKDDIFSVSAGRVVAAAVHAFACDDVFAVFER